MPQEETTLAAFAANRTNAAMAASVVSLGAAIASTTPSKEVRLLRDKPVMIKTVPFLFHQLVPLTLVAWKAVPSEQLAA